AEDGIRDSHVTGVQTCALPISDPEVGLDCSGFVQLVYRELGIELPRVSRDQARAGEPVASLEEARPGDLIAFGSPVDHIAIYVESGRASCRERAHSPYAARGGQ